MANQPEIVQYDAGIYQLEIIDPVDGGLGAVSNKPLLSLANRTAYLYQHVNNLESGATIPPGVAVVNSQAFSGTPTVPTPALGDSSLKIANTAFVQGTVNGLAPVNVAGGSNVTLTSVQAGNGILVFTGALTANIAVIVPAVSKTMIVENLTSGAFTLTVKTASGTGVTVTQGKTQELFCDGTNVLLSSNDFVNLALTGAPTSPTPALGDNSTKISNTAFVLATIGGYLSKSVAGGSNVTLSAVEAGNGIISLTGALTANIAVILPTSPTRTWVIQNNTSGVFTVTVKTAAGTGVVVSQGLQQVLACDGTNVFQATNDYQNAALTGSPTAPTAAQFDSSTKVANTAFVQQAVGNYSSIVAINAVNNLLASQTGSLIYLSASAAYNLGLPPVASGLVYRLYNSSLFTVTLFTSDSSKIFCGGINATTFALPPSGSIELFCASGAWVVMNGNAAAQLAANGYQKFPDGLIIQWGQITVPGNASASFSFPIAFTSGCYALVGTRGAPGSNASMNFSPFSASQFTAQNYATGSEIATWIATGK